MLKSPNKQVNSAMVNSIDKAADTIGVGDSVEQTQDVAKIDNINQERDPIELENTIASNSFMSPFNVKSPIKELNYSNVLRNNKTASTSPTNQWVHASYRKERKRNKRIQDAYAAHVNAKMIRPKTDK